MTSGRDAGFTLLEVLIAMLVFGFLITGLVQATRFGLQAWGAQIRVTATGQELELVDRTLRRLIGTVDPNVAFGARAFTGSAGTMSFTAALPEVMAGPGTRQADVSLFVTPAHVLTLRWAPHYSAPLAPVPIQATPLLEGVERMELAFFGDPPAPPGWSTVWPAGDTVPGLVRIRLVFRHGDPRRWPPLIASTNTR